MFKIYKLPYNYSLQSNFERFGQSKLILVYDTVKTFFEFDNYHLSRSELKLQIISYKIALLAILSTPKVLCFHKNIFIAIPTFLPHNIVNIC